jgi:UDP-N-acetylglucosamine 2-epimerase (non-hydrolysing)
VAATCEGEQRIVVVTAHRRENWEGGLLGIAEGVAGLAAAHPEVRFVVPMHPNPLVRQQLGKPLGGIDNVVLTEPMGYASFAHLLSRCHLVITDSGGIQEEAPSLGKPVLVARSATERTEGIEAGTLALVGTDPKRLVEHGERLLNDPTEYQRMADAPNPYGDGRAAERIIAALDHLYQGGEPPPQFGSGYERTAVLAAAGYTGNLDPGLVPAHERGTDQDELGPEEDQAATELWPT